MEKQIEFARAAHGSLKAREKEGKRKPLLTFPIARTLTGGVRRQDVSFSFLGKAGVKGEIENQRCCQT